MRLFFRGYLIFLIGLLLSENIFAQEQKPPIPAPAGVSQEAGKEAEKAIAPVIMPVIEIKRLDTVEPLYSFELRDVEIGDLLRVLAHDYKLNFLVDKDVQGKVTASLTNVSLEEALETIAESQNLILEKKKNIIKITPNLISKTFILKYIEAKKLLEAPAAGVAGAVAGAAGAGAGAAVAGVSIKQASTIYDLLSDKGKVLLGNQLNSIMVIDYPSNIKRIEEYLTAVDQRMTAETIRLKYLSIKDIFPEIEEKEREERKKRREERQAETEEIKAMKETESK